MQQGALDLGWRLPFRAASDWSEYQEWILSVCGWSCPVRVIIPRGNLRVKSRKAVFRTTHKHSEY